MLMKLIRGLTKHKFLVIAIMVLLVMLTFEGIVRFAQSKGFVVYHTHFPHFLTAFGFLITASDIAPKFNKIKKWLKFLWILCGAVAILSMVTVFVDLGTGLAVFFQRSRFLWFLAIAIPSLWLKSKNIRVLPEMPAEEENHDGNEE